MSIVTVSPKISSIQMMQKQSFEPKFRALENKDTFVRESFPKTKQQKIEEFANDLVNLMVEDKCTPENLQSLMRSHVPNTKLKDEKYFLGYAVASYTTKHIISKSNNKFHTKTKKINVNLDHQKHFPQIFFDNITHEMIHNFQEWDFVKFANNLYNDNFEKNEKTLKTFENIIASGILNAENLLTDFATAIYNIPVAFLKVNKNLNQIIPTNINENEKIRYKKVYYSIIKNILEREQEAYSVTNNLDEKYFGKKTESNSFMSFTCRYLTKFVDLKLKNIDKKLEKSPTQTLISS